MFIILLLPADGKYMDLPMSNGYLAKWPEPSGIITSYTIPPSVSTQPSHENKNAVTLAIPSLGLTVHEPEDGGEFTEIAMESLVGCRFLAMIIAMTS